MRVRRAVRVLGTEPRPASTRGWRHSFATTTAGNTVPTSIHWNRSADGSRKLYGDNVDAVYCFLQVRGDQQYAISGQRFDSCYRSFCLYGGDPNGELADR